MTLVRQIIRFGVSLHPNADILAYCSPDPHPELRVFAGCMFTRHPVARQVANLALSSPDPLGCMSMGARGTLPLSLNLFLGYRYSRSAGRSRYVTMNAVARIPAHVARERCPSGYFDNFRQVCPKGQNLLYDTAGDLEGIRVATLRRKGNAKQLEPLYLDS